MSEAQRHKSMDEFENPHFWAVKAQVGRIGLATLQGEPHSWGESLGRCPEEPGRLFSRVRHHPATAVWRAGGSRGREGRLWP